ncbi:unnamed protein product [Gongylonema pulchrum]|uniref:Transmembrane protein n=1 Tax=Gongylonema pulchrum TaxID=637853 RepID=A0A183CWP2_9BILA|nr:unnamed protein product [Gongylonema pulchrum]
MLRRNSDASVFEKRSSASRGGHKHYRSAERTPAPAGRLFFRIAFVRLVLLFAIAFLLRRVVAAPITKWEYEKGTRKYDGAASGISSDVYKSFVQFVQEMLGAPGLSGLASTPRQVTPRYCKSLTPKHFDLF